jgi:hypothetical protein
VALSRGPRCASDDQDRLLELRDTRDGRVLAAAQGGFVSRWGASVLVVDGDKLIDPGSGVALPDVPGWAVAVSDGQAISRLGDGGVALFRLAPVSTPERTPARVVAQMPCAWPDFAHVAVAQADNLRCPDLQSAAGGRRIALSPGRQPTLSSMTINSIDTNASRRVITVHYAQSVTSRWAGPTAQVAVSETWSDTSWRTAHGRSRRAPSTPNGGAKTERERPLCRATPKSARAWCARSAGSSTFRLPDREVPSLGSHRRLTYYSLLPKASRTGSSARYAAHGAS